MQIFKGAELQRSIIQEFLSIGVNSESAEHAARSMVETSLRGVDSHGINLFPHYHRSFISGRLNKDPQFKFTNSKPTAFVLDADHAIGHHAGIVAMDKCISVAEEYGLAACTVKNSSHYGASAYFGLHAAKAGMIGLSFTNADALVKAFNGKSSFFGTNPICFCAPMNDEDPFCLDMATSLVSWNKIKNYRRMNEEIPEHWAYDANGQAVTDPHEARSLSPIGDYKGFGLGMMVEVLCALLSGSVIGKDMLAMFTSPPEAQRQVSHFFMAIDINSFIPEKAFKDSLSSMANQMRNMAKLGNESVQVPGDPEKKTYKERQLEGIPVLDEVVGEYLDINPQFEQCLKS